MAYRSVTTRAYSAPAYPRVVADVGGTNARFAVETEERKYRLVQILACAEYPSFDLALRAYLAHCAQAGVHNIRHVGVAIANPVAGPEIRMTNHHWSFSVDAVRESLALDTLVVMNDFSALAMAVPYLGVDDVRQCGGGEPRPSGAIGLIGPGTGLGTSGLVRSDGGWIALESEGGHVTFSPANEREANILRVVWRQYGHVSAERLLSGSGLQLLYRVICELDGEPIPELSPADIVARSVEGDCRTCEETVATFCAMLGTVAGNLCMTLGATAGVYIGGGIVPRLGENFYRSSFRQRFEDKGRFAGYLARVPVFVILAEQPAFLGVSAFLSDHRRWAR